MSKRHRTDPARQEVIEDSWMARDAYRDAEARLAQMEHNQQNKLRVGLPLARVKRFSVARPSS